MKSIVVLALVLCFALAVYASCDATSATNCATTASTCIAGSTDLTGICNCMGPYATCLKGAGCWDATYTAEFTSTCETAGCTAAQCSSASSVAVSVLALAGLVAALF